MLYFPFVHQVLDNPTIISFSNAVLPTNVDVDIMLYNVLNNTYFHLGLGKTEKTDYYYPKTFYDRRKDDHVSGQMVLPLKEKRIELLN